MTFLATNLDDFHKNQHGEAKTTAEIRFVDADGILEAQEFMKLNYPEHPWSLVCKQVFDANIILKCVNNVN